MSVESVIRTERDRQQTAGEADPDQQQRRGQQARIVARGSGDREHTCAGEQRTEVSTQRREAQRALRRNTELHRQQVRIDPKAERQHEAKQASNTNQNSNQKAHDAPLPRD